MNKFFRRIRRPFANIVRAHAAKRLLLSELIYHTAQLYVKSYKGFTYDPYQNGEIELIRCLAHKIDVAFDVGANVGDWSKYLNRLVPTASIHAFEIIPEVADQLHARCENFAKINRFGLSKEEAEIKVIFSPDQPERSRMIVDKRVDKDFQTKTCLVKTGDSYCKTEGVDKIDIMKVDVEGAEQDVLFGLKETIAASKISVIQFEYNHARLHSRFLLGDFYDLLGKQYVLGRLTLQGVEFKDYALEDEDFRGPNYVAVLRSRPDLISLVSA